MNNQKVAFLLDFENFIIGVENVMKDSKKPFYFKSIISYVEQHYGRIVYRRAFADWCNTKYRKYSYDMMKCGFEMQHILKTNKNYSESIIVLQAMDCIMRNPLIEVVVLATGDADFLPLVSHLKSQGKTVIGIASENTVSSALLSNCDEFIIYGEEGLYKNTAPILDKATIIKTIRNIVGTTGLYLDELENELKMAIPEFTPELFGEKDFQDFISNLSNVVTLENAEDGIAVLPCAQPSFRGGKGKYSRHEFYEQAALPLSDYMETTRWFIHDGKIREKALVSIYELLCERNGTITNEELKDMVTDEMSIDDKEWQGTIYSLVCGSCIWERQESTPPIPSYMRKLSIYKDISSLEDFMVGYYSSLFHKAIMERKDVTPRSMAELMYPDDVEGHLPLFEKVMLQFTDDK